MKSSIAKNSLCLGALVLMLGVLIGAFGAHGLRSMVSSEHLATFETGVRYQFYHGFGLLVVGLLALIKPQLKLNFSVLAFVVGILLFSFNCYFYVLTQVKVFALIVPMGGVLFVLGWAFLAKVIFQMKDTSLET